MNVHDIRTSTVTVDSLGTAVDAYLAEPVEEGTYPAVIIFQEIFGVNSHIRDVTERFAKLGYVAIAPALYQRLQPGFETGYTPDAITIGRQYKQQTNADELLADIRATIQFLQQHPHAKAGAVGCIGFCFGGHVAYLAATLPDIQATASFYGAGITNWCPGDGAPTLSRTAEIHGVIHLFFGLQDASIPPTDINLIEAELTKHQITHKIWQYSGADHGFFCDQRGSYNADAATDAWGKVQDLFQNFLRVN
jgi:carboxymethylenebutenolidase